MLYAGNRMDERLRPTQRLRHAFEITRVFEKGRTFRCPCLRIHYLPSGRESSRLGLVVTRKVGGAVQRNRVKRLLREVFRRQRRLLASPLDVVLVALGGVRAHAEYLDAFQRFAAKVSGGAACVR